MGRWGVNGAEGKVGDEWDKVGRWGGGMGLGRKGSTSSGVRLHPGGDGNPHQI